MKFVSFLKNWQREYALPIKEKPAAAFDDAAAQAKLENGILVLTLPKKELAQTKKLAAQ